MKILYKISILIAISVLALIIIPIISVHFKQEELKYYHLVENIKTLHNYVLNALVQERNFEKHLSTSEEVELFLADAQTTLDHVDVSLLEENSDFLEDIGFSLNAFSSSFTKIIAYREEFLTETQKLDRLAELYIIEYEKLDRHFKVRIQEHGNEKSSLMTQLQEIQGVSSSLLHEVEHIMFSVNKDLLFDGNLQEFEEHYQHNIQNFKIQKKMLKRQSAALNEEAYLRFSQLTEKAYVDFQIIVSLLTKLYRERQKVYQTLYDHEQQISGITGYITTFSEELREEKNKTASYLQWSSQILVTLVLVGLGVLIGRSITKPLSILTQSTQSFNPEKLEELKTRGKSEEEKQLLQSKDEFGLLARSFDEMRQTIIRKIELIEEYNRTLEQTVQKRSLELKEKTKDIQFTLNNLQQGIFTLVEEGRIQEEYSSYLEKILETDEIANQNVIELIFSNSNLSDEELQNLKTSISSILGEDVIMFGINSHLLVTEAEKKFPDGRMKVLGFAWTPITGDEESGEEDIVQKLLVTVRDLTELKGLQNQAISQERELEIIDEILSLSQNKFQNFTKTTRHVIEESQTLLQNTTEENPEVMETLSQNIYALRGSAEDYGLKHLLQTIRETEQTYHAVQNHEKDWDRDQLLEMLNHAAHTFEEYTNVDSGRLKKRIFFQGKENKGNLRNSKIQRLLKDMEKIDYGNTKAVELLLDKTRNGILLFGLNRVDQIVEESIEPLLILSQQLNKMTPVLVILDNQIHVDDHLAGILRNIITHLYRNAIDHGLEASEERLSYEKEPKGKIYFEVRLKEETLHFSFYDDGQGLDLFRIRNKAIEYQILSPEERDIEDEEIAQLIFHPGFSTAQKFKASLSGYGLGMDTVKKFVEKERGSIQIELLDENSYKKGFRHFRFNFTLPGKSAVHEI